jgi:hypothetical protein
MQWLLEVGYAMRIIISADDWVAVAESSNTISSTETPSFPLPFPPKRGMSRPGMRHGAGIAGKAVKTVHMMFLQALLPAAVLRG